MRLLALYLLHSFVFRECRHDEKATRERETDTPKKGLKRGCSVSQLTNRDKRITKNLKSPQEIAKNARKTQNLDRFSELFQQNRPLDGILSVFHAHGQIVVKPFE